MVVSGCNDVCDFADSETKFYTSVEVYSLKTGKWTQRAGTKFIKNDRLWMLVSFNVPNHGPVL